MGSVVFSREMIEDENGLIDVPHEHGMSRQKAADEHRDSVRPPAKSPLSGRSRYKETRLIWVSLRNCLFKIVVLKAFLSIAWLRNIVTNG